MKHQIATHKLIFGLIPFLVVNSTFLFRRKRSQSARSDAHREFFDAIETLLESSAGLRPEWHAQWRDRRQQELPPKYDTQDELIINAVHDMRFATALLRRYRWKSVVQPLFNEIDEPAFSRFSATASDISTTLLAIVDQYTDRLREDEIDWINTAVEQFDEATRRRRRVSDGETPRAQQVAEGTYQPIYIAIQLSDRLIERLRYDEAQR